MSPVTVLPSLLTTLNNTTKPRCSYRFFVSLSFTTNWSNRWVVGQCWRSWNKSPGYFETFSILILIFPSNFWNALSKSKNDPPICIKFGIEFVKKKMLYHIICWVIFHYNVPTKDKILIHIILQNIVLRSYLVFRRKISSYHYPYYPSNSPLCVTRDSIIWRFGPCFTVLLYNEIQCGF